jgi:hypothetical protein
LTFELVEQPASEQLPTAEPDFARWRSCEGEVTATFHRVPGGYLVRFIGRADFTIALDEGVVLCRPATGTPAGAARDLYLNQILPMIRAHQGELIIHASAVAIDGSVAGFVGPTGRGKSTLAAAFARAGNPFLSDDGLCLTAVDGRYLASPNRPSFRLWLDSRAAVVDGVALPAEQEDAKSRVEAGAQLPFQAEALPLGAIYFLGEGNSAEPTIAALSAKAGADRADQSNVLSGLGGSRADAASLRSAQPAGRNRAQLCARLPARLSRLANGDRRRIRSLPKAGGFAVKLSESIRVSDEVVSREVGDETMLLDLSSGTYFGLDPVGARFWQLLEEGKSPIEARETLAAEYDVEPAQLERDLEALLDALASHGLVSAAG